MSTLQQISLDTCVNKDMYCCCFGATKGKRMDHHFRNKHKNFSFSTLSGVELLKEKNNVLMDKSTSFINPFE